MQALLLDYQKQDVGTVFNVANCGHMKISVTSIFTFLAAPRTPVITVNLQCILLYF